MPIQTILFDVGGTLVDESAIIPKWEVALIEAANEITGTAIPRETFERIHREVIDSYAPFTFRSTLFHLVGDMDDLFEQAYTRFLELCPEYKLTLFPGVAEMLNDLKGKVTIGIVANQGAGLYERLSAIGIGDCFDFICNGGDHGLYKPDIRIFLQALGHAKTDAANTLMVGDRIDNDIVPAKLLGIKTLLFRTGWHAIQRPRTPAERPDYLADSADEMISIIRDLTS